MRPDTIDWACLVILGAILVWDAYLARKGEGNTLSFRWARWARQWPIIPLLVGILVGHLFFPNRGYCP